MRNIDFIRDVKKGAENHWPELLQRLGIVVPDSPRKHGPCPACGGRDRFRFDDEGRGRHICNQCGAGDGLDLIQKVKSCDVSEAAKLVAGAMAMPLPEHPAKERNQADKPIAEKVAALLARTHLGESLYLNNKGLQGHHPLLADGSLALVLRTLDGSITGAQVIHPNGKKRYLSGSRKKGAFIPVGDIPEQVDTVLITEGYATALSVAALEGGLALAALDANNLLPVAQAVRQRWPEAEIIIAGDNDITPDGPNVGKEAAEKAALTVSGFITLPPTDYKADWDDYRQQHGLIAFQRDFVANIMLPGRRETPDETVEQNKENDVVSKLTVIEGGKKAHREYDPLKPWIDNRQDGIFWVTPKVDKESGEIINIENWLCSPLEVLGKGEDGKERYLILTWSTGKQKEPTTKALRAADIGEREGWRALKAGGVDVTTKPSLRAILGDWLQRSAGDEMWSITPRSGWHKGAYIMPDGSIIGTPEQPILFSGGTAAAEAYTVAGTAESWRENIAKLAEGNPFQMLAVGVALAAPLLALVGADGFGVHLYAQSTAGKTTAEDLASSLYGEPERQRLTWYGTALGVANEAEAHNHGLLSLDEVDQGAAPKHVYTAAYTLFNGKGKLQGSPEGGNRVQKYWKTAVISTGERDLETYLKSAGIKVNAGQLVRLLNIPVTRPTQLHGYESGKAHADALKEAWKQNHGAAGREWIQYLSSRKQEAIEAYQKAKRRWQSLIPESYGEQVHRVTDRFAVIEAALIMGRVITGWEAQGCRDALQHIFSVWVATFGTGNKEIEQIKQQVEAFLNNYGFSRYLPYPNPDPRDLPVHKLAGYRTGKAFEEGASFRFYTFPNVFEEEIANGFEYKEFARVLAELGMLETGGDRYKKKALNKIGGKQHVFYVLMFGPEETDLPKE